MTGRPRINPPSGAVETIKRLASEGNELITVAEFFGVHVDLLNEWFDSDPRLSYAFTVGQALEKLALHKIVVNSAKNGVTAASRNAQYILTARYGYKVDDKSNQVTVNVAPQNVMVMKDHGTDEEWQAKAAAQQSKLILNAASDEPRLEAPAAPQFATGDSQISGEGLPIPTPSGAACAASVLNAPPQWSAPCWIARA
jgi:hypothetical protein